MSQFFPEPAEMGHHTLFPGVVAHTAAAEKMMLSIVDLEAHSVVPEHSHPHEQVGMMLFGEAVFTIAGEERTLRAGDCYRIPGDVKHKVVTLGAPARALDIFYPIREEYR